MQRDRRHRLADAPHVCTHEGCTASIATNSNLLHIVAVLCLVAGGQLLTEHTVPDLGAVRQVKELPQLPANPQLRKLVGRGARPHLQETCVCVSV